MILSLSLIHLFIIKNIVAYDGILHNEWVVRILGGPAIAKKIAEDFGYKFQNNILGFNDTYLFIDKLNEFPQKRGNVEITFNISEDSRVLWAKQQRIKSRYKRYELGFLNRFTNLIPIEIQRNDRLFNDELWTQEWYLQDTRAKLDLPKLDLNVLPVYRAGITGKGVRVTILDDGIEYTHDDLKNNYDSDISYDCNEDDLDPFPRYDSKLSNNHGTRCAGEVAMTADNGKCGVGVAYNSKIGGIRMLDGFVNDRVEGIALGYAHTLVDIYSASWGPSDDGKTVDGPDILAKEAMERGIKEGRNGLGCIYVWASGNGGGSADNCNCDGYVTSPYTIAIGSASQRGFFPWYGEKCAATMAVTYSSGTYSDQMIATTDLGNSCTLKHTGTSASAPLAAGIIALALEANPLLSWRDVQHLIVWTSDWKPLANNYGWQKNAAGLWFNNRFGFGLMNAEKLVFSAKKWTPVSKRKSCSIIASYGFESKLFYGKPFFITYKVNLCDVKYLEHLEIRISIDYSTRGDLELFLTSPKGTVAQILGRRPLDKSNLGFKNWKFMSVMTWGEKPQGLWTLKIIDQKGLFNNTGKVINSKLIIYGTEDRPVHMKNKNYFNKLNNNASDYYNKFTV